MRFLKLLIGDIRFQFKYGFYFLYAIFLVVYLFLLYLIPPSFKEKTAAILILTDPAAMGLFFMGAIILLEKNQRVLNSLAVSPVKNSEYILSKLFSLTIIGLLVGVLLMITVKIEVIKIVGIILGSLFFSLLGMLAALYSKSLNMFVVIIIPIEVLFMLPAVFYLFGFAQNILILHPAVIILRFILGDTNNSALFLIELMVWIVIIYYITNNKLNKTLKELGGLIL